MSERRKEIIIVVVEPMTAIAGLQLEFKSEDSNYFWRWRGVEE